VNFEGRPTFNKDTAGFAVVKKDASEVEIKFDKEYAQTPLINISISMDDTVTDQDRALLSPEALKAKNEAQKVIENAVLNGDIRFIVTRRTTKSFIIKLNKPASDDLKFSWSALAVKDPKTIISAAVLGSNTQPTPGPSIQPSAIPSPTNTPSPLPSPTASPQITQTVTVNPNPLGFLRVRDGPSANANEIGQVNPGQTFTVIDTQSGWFKIEYSPGLFGWVSGAYVTVK
jgi:hypothetical protein